MNQIRVEPGQLRTAAQALGLALLDINGYQSIGPPELSNQAAGDISLAEATGVFRRHWMADAGAISESTRNLMTFLGNAAEAYQETDNTVGRAGG